MTNIDLILETLEELTPQSCCDDCLSEQLGITPRQQVNAICNKLNSQRLTLRTKALCDQCRRVKLVNSFHKKKPKLETFLKIGSHPPITTEKSRLRSFKELAKSSIFENTTEKESGNEQKLYLVAGKPFGFRSSGAYNIPVEAVPPPSLDVEHIRTQIVRICHQLWRNNRKDSIPFSISKTINTLKEDRLIPHHQANMMLTICGLRNVFVYENTTLGLDEMAIAGSAWRIITDWWNKTFTQ